MRKLAAICRTSIFERDEILAIFERATCETQGQLHGMVRYLLTTEHAQDAREAEALAQLTDACAPR